MLSIGVFVCVFVCGSGYLSGSCPSYVPCTHDVIDDVTRLKSRSNFEITITQLVSFWVSFSVWKIVRSKKNTYVFENFQNPCYVHDNFSFASAIKPKWQIISNESVLTTITSSMIIWWEIELPIHHLGNKILQRVLEGSDLPLEGLGCS